MTASIVGISSSRLALPIRLSRNFFLPFVIFFPILILSNRATAQTNQIAIIVSATSDDIVGQRLVYKVKEELRRSTGLRLAEANENSGLYLRLVTLDSDTNAPGVSTTYSAVWVLESPDFIWPYFLHATAGYCGTSRVDETAQSLVAITDEVLVNTQRYLQNLQTQNSATQSDGSQ